MPALRCTAVRCVYNKEELCSKGDIKVDGEQAMTSDETCCSSFQERTGTSNSTGCGCDTICVKCSAHDCTFNKSEECHAGSIDIQGAKAETQDETCCGTFRCK